MSGTLLIVADGHSGLYGDPDGPGINLTEASAKAIIAKFKAQGVDVPIDHEHSSVDRAASGLPSPAVGWIKTLAYKAGKGLVASVEWLADIADDIRDGKYKYLSPVLLIRKKTGEPLELHSAAITNKPRIVNSQQLAALMAASQHFTLEAMAMADTPATPEGGEGVTPEQQVGKIEALLEAKGVAVEGSGLSAVLAAVIGFLQGADEEEGEGGGGGSSDGDSGISGAKSGASGDSTSASVKAKLGLEKDATEEDVLAALSDRSIPDAQYEALKAKTDALEANAAARDKAESDAAVEELFQLACSSGKILPDDEKTVAWFKKKAAVDIDDAKITLEKMAILVEQGRVVKPGGDGYDNNRQRLIAASVKEWDGIPVDQRMAGKPAWVNLDLGKAGEGALSDEELKTL